MYLRLFLLSEFSSSVVWLISPLPSVCYYYPALSSEFCCRSRQLKSVSDATTYEKKKVNVLFLQ